MKPKELRAALASRYREDGGVLVAGEAAPFAYSDGEAAEAYVAESVQSARDRARRLPH